MSWKARGKELILRGLGRLTGRHAALLPAQAAREESLLRARTPYRVEGEQLEVGLLEPDAGRLEARLLAYEGHFPRRQLWRGKPRPYPGPCSLRLDLAGGEVRLGQALWGKAPVPLPGRRCAWELQLAPQGGGPAHRRLTGHYLPGTPGPTGAAYFTGDNYVDHEAESRGDGAKILELLKRHEARGPVLEVGCATGGVLTTLAAAGFEAWGVDFSEWAVGQARKSLGEERIFLCDLNRDPIPPEIEARRPFGALVLWMVLEHFARPFEVLERLARLTEPGGLLLIYTTNAESLSHRVLGKGWEGFFDATHHGVEEVSASSLRTGLPAAGWAVESLATRHLWASSPDPTVATLRDWYALDARFRRLLEEQDLGDFIEVAARRRATQPGAR